jgi:hypothetical protein
MSEQEVDTRIRLSGLYQKMIGKEDTVLNVGCGPVPTKIRCHKEIRLDIWAGYKPTLIANVGGGIIPIKTEAVDVVIMMDFIEHLNKEVGFLVIEEAKRVTRRAVIIMTPLRWDTNEVNVFHSPNKWGHGNPYNLHQSHWKPEEFPDWERWDSKVSDVWKHYLGVWTK